MGEWVAMSKSQRMDSIASLWGYCCLDLGILSGSSNNQESPSHQQCKGTDYRGKETTSGMLAQGRIMDVHGDGNYPSVATSCHNIGRRDLRDARQTHRRLLKMLVKCSLHPSRSPSTNSRKYQHPYSSAQQALIALCHRMIK